MNQYIIIIFIIIIIFLYNKKHEKFTETRILPYALFINIKSRTDRLNNVLNQMKEWPKNKLIRISGRK